MAAFAGGLWLASGRGGEPPAPAPQGMLWPNPPAVAPFSLTDQTGAPFSQDRLRGRWSLVFFGFTHCPHICPATLQVLNAAVRELDKSGPFRDYGRVVLVSVDPDNDTPERMAQYLRGFNPDFEGLTGPKAEIERVGRDFGVVTGTTAGGEIDHSAAILVVDSLGRRVGVLSAPHDAATIAARVAEMRAFVEANAGT
ncbi:MAG: SCO family protein [Gammaproteobacteria bacterium]